MVQLFFAFWVKIASRGFGFAPGGHLSFALRLLWPADYQQYGVLGNTLRAPAPLRALISLPTLITIFLGQKNCSVCWASCFLKILAPRTAFNMAQISISGGVNISPLSAAGVFEPQNPRDSGHGIALRQVPLVPLPSPPRADQAACPTGRDFLIQTSWRVHICRCEPGGWG